MIRFLRKIFRIKVFCSDCAYNTRSAKGGRQCNHRSNTVEEVTYYNWNIVAVKKEQSELNKDNNCKHFLPRCYW